jgi:hypothetical protein
MEKVAEAVYVETVIYCNQNLVVRQDGDFPVHLFEICGLSLLDKLT